MSLLQKTIAELRELQHEEIDLVGGGGSPTGNCGPTGEPTTAPTWSWVHTPIGQENHIDDGAGDVYSDYGTDCF